MSNILKAILQTRLLTLTNKNKFLLSAKTHYEFNYCKLLFQDQQRNYCSKYYSNKKTRKPSVIRVTQSNAHLVIDLFDENDVRIGEMNLKKAENISKVRELKLVLFDEDLNPPKFRLMTGRELNKEQMKKHIEAKELKAAAPDRREKVLQINLKISDHDLGYKLKSFKEHIEKGHPVKIEVKTNIKNEDINSLQTEIIDKIKTGLQVTNFVIKKRDLSIIILLIPSKVETPVAPNKKI